MLTSRDHVTWKYVQNEYFLLSHVVFTILTNVDNYLVLERRTETHIGDIFDQKWKLEASVTTHEDIAVIRNWLLVEIIRDYKLRNLCEAVVCIICLAGALAFPPQGLPCRLGFARFLKD